MTRLKGNRAQALVEYVLIVGLVSLVFLAFTKVHNELIKEYYGRIVSIFWLPIP